MHLLAPSLLEQLRRVEFVDAEAGAAMRRALQRAEVNELTRGDWRVLGAVLVLTASYSRVADFVYVAEVARHAGLNERRVGASLQRLVEFGVIEWEAGRGRGGKSLLGLPPQGKGGPTVVRLPKKEKRSHGWPVSDLREAVKPDNRKPAYEGPTPEKGFREDISSAASSRSTTTPQPADESATEERPDFDDDDGWEVERASVGWDLSRVLRDMPE